MTLQLSQKELETWEQFIYETTPDTAKAAPATPAQTVTNNITINFTYAVQNVIVGGGSERPLAITNILESGTRRPLNGNFDKYLPAMYQSGNMEATAQRLLKEKAGYR